jgi:hypothetical protein
LSAARLWKSYRIRLAEERRAQWATGLAVVALAAAAWFAAWILVVLAFYAVLGVAILRSGLFDALLPPDSDYDEF